MKRKETKIKVFIRTNRYCLYSVNMFYLSAIIFVSLIVRVVFEWKFCLHHSHDSWIISINFSLSLVKHSTISILFFYLSLGKNHVFGFNQNKQKKVEKNVNVSRSVPKTGISQLLNGKLVWKWNDADLKLFKIECFSSYETPRLFVNRHKSSVLVPFLWRWL